MPFTISHAAAAMPFRRTRLVISAVIVGCMAPDFEYFLHAGMYGRESHNLRGGFEFALPASLIVLVLFHRVLKRPLSALLPRAVQERIVFEDFRFWPLSRFSLIVLSILVGVASHLFWDAFTHEHGRAVIAIGWLRQSTTILGRTMPYFKVAQNLSTVAGLALLAVWVLHWYRSQPTQSTPEFTIGASVKVGSICLMIVVAVVIGVWRAHELSDPRPVLSTRFIANAVVAFVSTVCAELLLFSVAVRLGMHKEARKLGAASKF